MKAIKGRGRGAVSVAGFGEKQNSNTALRGQEMCRGIKRTPSIDEESFAPKFRARNISP
jgi:hypothetical protein